MYAGALLLLVFHTHVGPRCIVGVGAAGRCHLLQDSGGVLSRETEGGRQRREERRNGGYVWKENYATAPILHAGFSTGILVKGTQGWKGLNKLSHTCKI